MRSRSPVSDQRLARIVDVLIALQAVLALVLIGSLVQSQQHVSQQVERIQARDLSLDAAFNEFYCTARIGSVCADPSASATDLHAAFSADATSNSTSAIERSCQYVSTQLQRSNSEAQSTRRAVFLQHCAPSDAKDAWCSEFVQARAAGDSHVRAIATRASASPASECRAIFQDFGVAWTTRLEFDEVMLGIVCALQLLHCVAWTRMLPSDKRPTLTIDSDKKLV